MGTRDQEAERCGHVDGSRDDHTECVRKKKANAIGFTCGIKNMTQMKLPVKQKQTHRLVDASGEAGERGMDGESGKAPQMEGESRGGVQGKEPRVGGPEP